MADVTACFVDPSPGPRDACVGKVHDHPMPSSYLAWGDEADRRLALGWRNRKCSTCGLYGWLAPFASEPPVE